MKLFYSVVVSFCLLASGLAHSDGHGEGTASARMAAVQVSAVIVAIDAESREFGLEMPNGEINTLYAGNAVERFDEFAVGDAIVATYIQSLAAEVRAPTQAELDEPWVVLDAAAVADLEVPPGVAGVVAIRAVCSIEGMNRVTRTAMIQDSRGKYHVITDVDPARMAGLTLGTRVIMTYTRAVALTLEKAPAE